MRQVYNISQGMKQSKVTYQPTDITIADVIGVGTFIVCLCWALTIVS